MPLPRDDSTESGTLRPRDENRRNVYSSWSALSHLAHVGSRLPRVAHVVPDGRKWRGSAQGA
jgi:hypothetical protein